MAKRFTLTEASRLLPEIEKLIRDAVSLKSRYQDAERDLQSFTQRVAMAGGMMIDRDRAMELRSARDRHGERLRAVVEHIHEYGCLVKDLDTGLIDFPTLFRGREVYLCWRLGEERIAHWHGVDEGFAGRKPIDADFLENHQGDRSN
jgi:hypothetical protein